MQPLAVPLRSLDRVAEGMAEIQNRAPPGLALIIGNHFGFQLTRTTNRVGQRIGIFFEQCRHVVLEPGKEVNVANRAVLDDLGEVRPCSSRSGSVPQVSVSMSTTLWLVKCTNQVLTLRVVDARLAAHRRVNLREQRCRHLDEGHATHVARSGKTGDISHHTTTERNDRCVTIGATCTKGIEYGLHGLESLVCFAVWQVNAS